MGLDTGQARASMSAATAAVLERARRSFAAHKGWARRRRQWEKYLGMHGHEDCFLAFVEIRADLESEPPELYWRLLADTWTRDELPTRAERVWRALWGDPRPGRAATMDEGERAVVAALPEPVTVYRGCGDETHKSGLSWTLDRERAVWFAHNAAIGWGAARAGLAPVAGLRPLLVTGEVARGDVLAYLNGRGEREIISMAVRIINVQELEAIEEGEA